MSGNALEEGVMQQLNNPSHTDVGRIAVPFGAVFAILGYIGLGMIAPFLGWVVKLIAALGVYFVLSGVITRMMTGRRLKAEAQELQLKREIQNTETERQIALMNKRS